MNSRNLQCKNVTNRKKDVNMMLGVGASMASMTKQESKLLKVNTSKINEQEIFRFKEQLRQEQETFNERKKQSARWFALRLIMGYTAVLLLLTITVICSYILYNHSAYDYTVVRAVLVTLFTDVVGLLVSVWKVVLNPGSITKLSPTISGDLSNFQPNSGYDKSSKMTK